ncbi:MAG: hypothetical protein CFE45_20720 [Burkholderiales bacterium PBB5]|nr:MAG: hypothetical protein CFE45_20720 [Burkholderiales bacterium PBB5]
MAGFFLCVVLAPAFYEGRHDRPARGQPSHGLAIRRSGGRVVGRLAAKAKRMPTLVRMLDRQTLAQSWRHWWNWDAPPVGPAWLQALWPLLYAMAVALGFTVLGMALLAPDDPAWQHASGWLQWYGRCLVVSLCVTLAILGVMRGARRLVGPARVRGLASGWRTLFFSGLSMLGVALGWPLGMALIGTDLRALAALDAHSPEARLQLLQAQIEPHFLFNTLATVHSLMGHDTDRAQRMLEHFIDYLRGALGQLREGQATVASELALAETYLALMAQRMDDRLRYQVQASDAARAQPLPPLLLQPLIENAIRHGLEPSLHGGQVLVQAHCEGRRLRLSVRDTGVGLHAPRRPGPAGQTGNGIALANIRERLATRYGTSATLQLLDAEPGTLAVLDLPCA